MKQILIALGVLFTLFAGWVWGVISLFKMADEAVTNEVANKAKAEKNRLIFRKIVSKDTK